MCRYQCPFGGRGPGGGTSLPHCQTRQL